MGGVALNKRIKTPLINVTIPKNGTDSQDAFEHDNQMTSLEMILFAKLTAIICILSVPAAYSEYVKPTHYDGPIPIMHAFYGRITSRASADRFLQFTSQKYTHAMAHVAVCLGEAMISPGEPDECVPDSYEFVFLVQRLAESQDKSVLFVFSSTMCNLHPYYADNLEMNNVSTVMVGAAIAHGPGSEGDSELPHECLTEAAQSQQITVSMFDEKPAPGGYTNDQLAELIERHRTTRTDFVALEATFLANADFVEVLRLMRNMRVIIYHLQGQPYPDKYRLRIIVGRLQMVALAELVFVMLPREFMDRVYSALPNVDWSLRPSQIGNEFINPVTFNKYMGQAEKYVQMWVSVIKQPTE